MFLIFFLAGTVLVFIINKIEDTSNFYWYSEVVNTPIVFIVVFFFVFEGWNTLPMKGKQWSLFIIIALAIVRIAWIWNFGEALRQRTAQLERLVDYTQELKGSKFLLNEENYVKSYSRLTWASPIESLLFSAKDGKDQTVSIVSNADLAFNQNKSKLTDSTFVFRKFNLEPNSYLNPSYFQLNVESYRPLNTANLGDSLGLLQQGLSVEILNVSPQKVTDTIYLKVKIKNLNSNFIPSSLEDNIYLSYHWLQEGEIVSWDGLRTPLEVDVVGEYTQDISVAMPLEGGMYDLQPDIVIEGKAWLNLQQTFSIAVINP
jgi:hypothetical protein